jgi:hypothetical protein
MLLFFIFFVGTACGIHLKIHKNTWVKPQSLNLYSSEINTDYEIDNLFGSEYDIEMSDEEQFYHTLCKNNNETQNTFEDNYIFNIINHLRNNLLDELKQLELLEKELKNNLLDELKQLELLEEELKEM